MLHLLLDRHLPYQVMLHQRIIEGIDCTRLTTIKLDDIAILHILIDTIQIVHRPRLVGRCVEQINAKRQIRLIIAQMTKNRRHDIGLLSNGINLVSKSLCKPCDYCGVRSGADEDKFAKCGLTPVKAEGLEYAYAIKEAPVSISCKVKSVTELGSHDMFIGEIVAVTADSYLTDDKGRLCLDNAKLVAYNHGEYFLLGEKLGFFGYSVASPDVLKKRMGTK